MINWRFLGRLRPPANVRQTLALGIFGALASLAHAGPIVAAWQENLHDGERAREVGNVDESIALLEKAVQQAAGSSDRVQALTQLGLSLGQASRLQEAASQLQTAYGEAGAKARYPIALALGNLALRAQDAARATHFYEEVIATAGDDALAGQAKLSAELNLIRLQTPPQRLTQLEALLPRIESAADPAYRALALFSVGALASEALDPARPARAQEIERTLRLSYHGLSSSRELAQRLGNRSLAVDAADALAQLYEFEGRLDDALEINRRTIAETAGLNLSQAQFALVRLEWRAARVQHRRGEDAEALASYLRAAQYLESIRQDLPIEDLRGQSTYQTLQRPIFVGLLDLLLKDTDGRSTETQQSLLATALNLIELTHQAELQDYLGDRCSVDAVRSGANEALAPGVAIVYPVVIENRLAVLVRTADGVLQSAVPIPSAVLEREIRQFRRNLLEPDSAAYLGPARRLYDWLIAPFTEALDKAGVHELVIAPDGYLRLIPFAALHDGKQFLAQRYWLSTVTGLTMTEPRAGRRHRPTSLLAGLSSPGPVVDRLLAMGFTGGTTLSDNAAARHVRGPLERSLPGQSAAPGEFSLRSELALPGVQTEIQDLAPLSRSVWLLNDQFTVERFEREVQTGNYDVVHIASHSFFGSSVSESFLLAYDNVIHIDQLQRSISINGAQQAGIDLLTLSACDTATGDDRAPLGFAGAGIKARARTVVGSLWAVSDSATEQFMEMFYSSLSKQGKAAAFTQAQRSLLQSREFSHPYFWAPFILTGDWN